MCCLAGFSSMLVQVLYHLGSVHQRSLGHVGPHRSLSAFGCGKKQADRYMLPTDFYQLGKPDFICAAHW